MPTDHATSLRLVMMGTGPFAVPLLRALYGTPHQVVALVTQPPRATRPADHPTSPIRELASEHRTPILDPESVNTDSTRETLQKIAPDLLIVADYGQILSAQTLSVAPLGGLNLHGSLLPKYRGAAPINWAVYHGDAETGVTVIHMTPRVDAGPTLAQLSTTIDPDETAVELEQRLAILGAPLVVQAIGDVAAGRATPLPQDSSIATPARRMRKSDGAIDWSRPALAIKNQVRALEPWPRTYTFWHRPNGSPLRLIFGRCTVIEDGCSQSPGTVLRADHELVIATGNGALDIHELQPAGKRILTAAEFLRGYPVKVGDTFGP